ncbi:MAG TPA: patatin-like phospholipase family protein [Tahibacter sp.]|nr:patatin-like phospholipase family protein [Tahibacter sp.]
MATTTRDLTLALALQGGGAHGAFTWGVLDRLLEEPSLAIEAISATSSGAMNAVALAQGWLDGGRDGARATLAALWDAVAHQHGMLQWAFAGPAGLGLTSWLAGMSRHFAPTQINPLGINPLRGIVARLFDFERLRREAPFKLYVAATRVRDGALVLFPNERLDEDALLASTCLPQLFAPVVVDGEAYWDGGYAGNPALEPLVYDCASRDVVCVLVQPRERDGVPTSARDIAARVAELGFSTTFLREVATLRRAREALDGTMPVSRLGRRLRALNLHLIEPEAAFGANAARTPLNTHAAFLQRLRELGRERGEAWLDARATETTRRGWFG